MLVPGAVECTVICVLYCVLLRARAHTLQYIERYIWDTLKDSNTTVNKVGASRHSTRRLVRACKHFSRKVTLPGSPAPRPFLCEFVWFV